MKIDLNKIWSTQESSSNKNILLEKISSVSNLNCFIGLVGYTGARIFLLDIESTIDIHENYLRKFRGVEIQAIPSENSTVKKFTIILIENDLKDIFTLFIDDILDKLIPVSETKAALTVINQRIAFWRKLFARASGEFLSPEKQRGLFGELFILHQLLNYSDEKKLVLDSWVGSQSANQDFVIEDNAIEVKTSKSESPGVQISSEHQLNFHSLNHLYLCTVLVNESAGRQGTLYELINTIRHQILLDDNLVSAFEMKLELAGIPTDMFEEYNSISYTIRSCQFYRVCDGFPLITTETLSDDSVYNIKYQIDISKCEDFIETEEEVFTKIL